MYAIGLNEVFLLIIILDQFWFDQWFIYSLDLMQN